jgi:hypothetical protein
VETNFITCPFCSGHEVVSPEAASEIAAMIGNHIRDFKEGDSLKIELENIRNTILNYEQRQPPATFRSKRDALLD